MAGAPGNSTGARGEASLGVEQIDMAQEHQQLVEDALKMEVHGSRVITGGHS